MVTVPINYWAVLAAAVAQIVLGSLWYGPLFGKSWAGLIGWTPEAMETMKRDPKGKAKMMRGYIFMAVGAFLMAWILDHAIIFASAYLLITGVAAGLAVGFLNWLGFIAPILLSSVLWEGKPWKLWFINASYYLVGLLVMGTILSLWR